MQPESRFAKITTQYLHLRFDVSPDFVGLGSEAGSQLVVGVLLVKLTL